MKPEKELHWKVQVLHDSDEVLISGSGLARPTAV